MTNGNKNPGPTLVGVNAEFGENADGLYLKRSQEIPQQLLDSLKEQRNDSTSRREGEFMRVASIPAVVVEKWMREGFNILDPNVNGKEIVRRLKAENLDAFLTTDKSI
jgi:hypothetical protein